MYFFYISSIFFIYIFIVFHNFKENIRKMNKENEKEEPLDRINKKCYLSDKVQIASELISEK